MYVRTVGIAGRFKRKAGMAMKEVYFTITGMNHYLGSDFLKKGMKVKLIRRQSVLSLKVWARSAMWQTALTL